MMKKSAPNARRISPPRTSDPMECRLRLNRTVLKLSQVGLLVIFLVDPQTGQQVAAPGAVRAVAGELAVLGEPVERGFELAAEAPAARLAEMSRAAPAGVQQRVGDRRDHADDVAVGLLGADRGGDPGAQLVAVAVVDLVDGVDRQRVDDPVPQPAVHGVGGPPRSDRLVRDGADDPAPDAHPDGAPAVVAAIVCPVEIMAAWAGRRTVARLVPTASRRSASGLNRSTKPFFT